MNKKRKGFTLVELLVTVTIIGILASMGVLNYRKSQEKSRDTKRISDLNDLKTALLQYRENEGNLLTNSATTAEDVNSTNVLLSLKTNNYLDALPKPPTDDSKYYFFNTSTSTNAYLMTVLESAGNVPENHSSDNISFGSSNCSNSGAAVYCIKIIK